MQCRHCQLAKLMINNTDLNWKDCLCQTAWFATRQWIRRHRRHRTLSYIPVLFRDYRNRAKYDYTSVTMVSDGREKMRFLRHPPCPPGPLLPSTAESRPTKTPTTGGMISRFQLPTSVHPRRANGGHPSRAHATHGSRPRPAKTVCRNHRSGHHSSTVLTAYVYVTLRSTRSWSKMVNVIFRPYGRKFKHIYRLFSVRTDGNLQLN